MDGNKEKSIIKEKRSWQDRLNENDKKFLNATITQVNELIKVVGEQILRGFNQAWESIFFITADSEIPQAIQEFLSRDGSTENLKFLQELMQLDNLQMRSKYSTEPLSLSLKLQNLRNQLLFLS